MYIRPTNKANKAIGFVCQCGEVVFDDGRAKTPMDAAWAVLLKRGGSE